MVSQRVPSIDAFPHTGSQPVERGNLACQYWLALGHRPALLNCHARAGFSFDKARANLTNASSITSASVWSMRSGFVRRIPARRL